MAMSSSSDSPAGSAGPPSAVPAPSVGDLAMLGRLRFLAFGRAVPAVFFGALAYNQFGNVARDVRRFQTYPDSYTASVLPRDVLYLLFCAMPVGIYLTRGVPRASDGSLPARAAAFLGTTILLIIGAFIKNGVPLWSSDTLALWVAAPILATAFAFAVVSMLYLRRNLSIMPEARALVTGGPYRLVRHPLYLAEISAAAGFVIGSATVAQVAGLMGLIGLQITRTHYEERLLRRTVPGYIEYAAGTRKIIPGVW